MYRERGLTEERHCRSAAVAAAAAISPEQRRGAHSEERIEM